MRRAAPPGMFWLSEGLRKTISPILNLCSQERSESVTMDLSQSVSRDAATTLSDPPATRRSVNSSSSLSASFSEPIQRNLRISLTSSFNACWSAKPSWSFCRSCRISIDVLPQAFAEPWAIPMTPLLGVLVPSRGFLEDLIDAVRDRRGAFLAHLLSER